MSRVALRLFSCWEFAVGKLMLFLLVLLVLLMVSAVLAYQYAGIWGLLGVIVAVIVLVKFAPKLIGAYIFRGLKKAMDATGAALRGATIEVHAVQPEDEPPPDEDDDFDDDFDEDFEEEEDDFEEDEDDDDELIDPELADLFYDGPRNWYSIDLTVQPAMRDDGRPTEYQPWSPHMLMLLGQPKEMPKPLGPMAAFAGMADGVCDIRKVEIWRDGAWETEEFDDDFGPQRLRLLAGVKPGESQLRVGYVSEIIGEVNLPDASQ
jgi:hypothetical protein